jgi:hypothetical protein
MGIEEGEELQTKNMENLFSKITAENAPRLEKEMIIQVHEALRTPKRQDQKRTCPYHIITKTSDVQNKGRILKTAREKCQVIYKGKATGITADFSSET